MFFYGGGFARGSRTSSSGLLYNNIGAFFATRGILTVIADYRLVPDAHFPNGSEDVRDALLWVIDNVDGDSTRLFLLGHSAGGVHVMSMLLLPGLFLSSIREAIRGVCLVGVPYDQTNSRSPKSRATTQAYYGGTFKMIAQKHPAALLRGASADHITGLPPVRNILAGSEPRAVKSGCRAFAEMYRQKGGAFEEIVLTGHDHTSPIVALSSGLGEDWAEELATLILAS